MESAVEHDVSPKLPTAPACPPWCPERDGHRITTSSGWPLVFEGAREANKTCELTVHEMRAIEGLDLSVDVQAFAYWAAEYQGGIPEVEAAVVRLFYDGIELEAVDLTPG